MRVVVFAGYSGAGKTPLIDALIPWLKGRGLRVSVVKHAHHGFDIDHPGKDSYRHRAAGAFEVVVASARRLALMREFEHELPYEAPLTVHQLIAELDGGVDWVLVEGFRHADLPKIEIWRAGQDRPPLYPGDPRVAALVTADAPPQATALPVFAPDAVAALGAWLLAHSARFDYDAARYLPDCHA
ncbi:MAG: molybdopterin-guanine dinucleotide biosynthesis protein B [Burkholderiaceae bacterium]|jgi:molybdopterin-guanine dinucleotide biosynthesis protein B|nr:molybdopterin-guanine dinucleotide biosynthesis protein B [Burkholderiaceae bacterium]